jgi:threonylcarbamoyladenosine tRNA methylthiotransferase MtaB
MFASEGFSIKEYGEASDVFVLNTCSVTENADKECRQIVRSVIRNNPNTYVVVTGCYAQLQPGEIAAIEGVDLVLGAKEKFKVLDYAGNFEKQELSCVFRSPIEEAEDFSDAFSADTDSRTRAFLKIQDGCNYKCSFCTIPLARGKSRSLELHRVIENAQRIIDSGYKEIVLTGVNTGDYSYTSTDKENRLREQRLVDVLYELDKLDIVRLRISSIEPNLLNDEIISFAKSSEKFCNHFHIPLQSGDKETLKGMRRRYTADYYRGLIEKITSEIKDVGIGVDVITGFPGETEERFMNTYNFLDSLPVSYLHVFTYSERRDTAAVTMPGRVPVNERRERTARLRMLSDKKRFEFYSRYIGTEMDVLFESEKNGMMEGLTTNYIRVKARDGSIKENEILPVRLAEADGVKPVVSVLSETESEIYL